MDCRVIRDNDTIRAHHRSRYFEIYVSTEDHIEDIAIFAAREISKNFNPLLSGTFTTQ